MDEESGTVINGLRTGLVAYSGHLGIKTKTYEVPIYRRMAELLKELGYKTCADRDYPDDTREECDLYIQKEEFRCWMEAKIAWKEWMSTATAAVKTANFDSYVTGPGPGRMGRSHSVAQDFRKLEQIGFESGTHLAEVAICFDAVHNKLDRLISQMSEEQKLSDRGWILFGPEIWLDRNSDAHRIACYLWVKKTALKPH